MRERDVLAIGAFAILLFGAVGYWKVKSLVDSSPPGTFNPGSTNNVIYGGVNAVGAAVTNAPAFSLGVSIWNLLHPAALAQENRLADPVPLSPGAQWSSATGPDRLELLMPYIY